MEHIASDNLFRRFKIDKEKYMMIVDVVLLIILAGFVFYGLFFGLIRTIGSLAGFIIGVWLANLTYLLVFGWLRNLFFGFDNTGKILIFMLVFTLINRLVSFAFAILDRTFDFISIIPFLKTINRLAGAAFGLIEGGLVLGLVLSLLLSYPIIGGWLNSVLARSQIMPYLVAFIEIVKPILPEILKRLKSLL